MDPVQWLRTLFLERKARNPSYSTYAFARDLGLSQSLLSRILNRRRTLTLKQASRIAALEGLGSEQTRSLLDAVFAQLPQNAKVAKKLERAVATRSATLLDFSTLELEKFKVVAHWHYYALLELSETRGFKADPIWIGRRLGISSAEAADALDRLIRVGLLRYRNQRLVKSDSRFYAEAKVPSSAFRTFHQQMAEKARRELDRDDEASFKRRDISGVTISVNPKFMPVVRERIRKFQLEMVDLLSEGDCTDVYQLNVQLFPLTQPGE